MCGGGPTGIGFVDNAIDKADNWTEGAGEQLAAIDPGPAIGDLGESFDKEVLQQVDIGTVATVAAIATQQYYLIPYIAAANTAIKGGDIVDIATSFGIAYVAGEFAPQISQGLTEAGAGQFAAAVGTGATVGAGSGAAGTVAAGGDFEDVLKGAGRGAVVGGVTAGVTQGVSQGYDAITTPDAIPIGVSPPAQEFGLKTSGTGDYGIQPPTQPSGTTDFGIKPPSSSYARTPLYADYGNIKTELGISRPTTSYGINPESTSTFGEINPEATGGEGIKAGSPETTPMQSQYVMGSETNPYEKAGKRIVSKAISGSILEELFPAPTYDPNLYGRRTGAAGDTGIDYGNTGDGSDLVGTTNVDLTAVSPSQYDLKKFVNATGDSRLISFKDNKPESPIPPGYTEAETIGKAEGGLIGNNSTTMVKYSKKALMGPRKTVKKPKEKKATAGKGLAVRKT